MNITYALNKYMKLCEDVGGKNQRDKITPKIAQLSPTSTPEPALSLITSLYGQSVPL